MPTDVKKSHSRVFSQFLDSFRLYFENILVHLAFRPNGSAVNKTIDNNNNNNIYFLLLYNNPFYCYLIILSRVNNI